MRSIILLAQNVSNRLHTEIIMAEVSGDQYQIKDLRDSLDTLYAADKSSLMDFANDIAGSGLDTIVRENLLVQVDEMARNMPSIAEGILA
jgi:hypothetical protein